MTDDPVTEGHASEVDDLSGLADLTAAEASAFLTSVTEVASGSSPDTALPLLTLALSQVLLAGARLGAIEDVVPEERFEPDAADDDAAPIVTDNDGESNATDGSGEDGTASTGSDGSGSTTAAG